MNAALMLAAMVAADGAAMEGGHVRLSVQAYEKLKVAASTHEAGEEDDGSDDEEATAAAPHLLDARIAGTLTRKSITLELTGTVEGTNGKWNVLHLLPSSVALAEVTTAGGPATVMGLDGMTSLVFQGAGRRTFRAVFTSVGGNAEGTARALELALLPGASRQFNLDLEGRVEPEVSPDALLDMVRTGPRRSIRGFIPANADVVSIRWDTEALVAEAESPEAPHRAPKPNEPARINVQASVLASVGERLLTTYATLRYAIFHAPVSRFEFVIPPGAELVGVQGRGVSTWTCAKPAAAGSTCSVELPFPVQRTYELSIQLEQALPRELRSVDVAIPQALGVQRQNGHVAVEVMGNAEVKPADGCSATREDVRELPSDLFTGQSTPILLAFKYLEAPTRVALDIQRRESVETSPISVHSAHYTTVWTTEGRTITEATLQVRNRQRQFLAMTLPPDAVIQSAFVADAPVKPSTGDDGRIRIPLRNQQHGSDQEALVVQVVYVRDNLPLPALGALEALLPALDSEIGALSHELVLPDRQRLWAFGGDLSVETPHVVHAGNVDHAPAPFLIGAAAMRQEMPMQMDALPSPDEAMEEDKAAVQIQSNLAKAQRVKRMDVSNVARMSARGSGAGGGGLALGILKDAGDLEEAAPMVGNTGVLPVRIQIPQHGDRYKAHAVYVPANAALKWSARTAARGAIHAVQVLAALLGMLLGVLVYRRRAHLLARGDTSGARLRALLLLVASALLMFWFRRSVELLPGFTVLGVVVAWTWEAVTRRAGLTAAPTPAPSSTA